MQKMTLKALRVNYDLTAKEVAQKVGIHHQTLLKYEKDSTNIPISLVNKLSKIYNIDSGYIFLGKKSDLKRLITH